LKRLVDRSSIPASLAVLALLVAVLLYLMPAESTLGNAIKAVFLHGAVARTGLIVFAVAGLVGIAYLVWKRQVIGDWCLTVQKTAVLLWIMYALTGLFSLLARSQPPSRGRVKRKNRVRERLFLAQNVGKRFRVNPGSFTIQGKKPGFSEKTRFLIYSKEEC